MDDINNVDESILKNLGGLDSNSLLHLVDTPDEDDGEPPLMRHSPYVDTESLANFMSKTEDSFTVLNLNIQSLNAKFDSLSILLEALSNSSFEFSVICLQETWIKQNMDISCLMLDNYNFEHIPSLISKHGGVGFYINKK